MSSKMFSKSSNSSSKIASSAASTYSTISSATTISGADTLSSHHKWYSLGSKAPKLPKSPAEIEKKRLHNEALASYFSNR
ncbi:hypothetical protein N7475_001291 [Penicillium sp. IBT 31633x]|nr:hypothetical protein N7475_001291 [Penicillium sp. IBT 31633x]